MTETNQLVVVQPTYQLRFVHSPDSIRLEQLWTHTSYDRNRIQKSVKMEWRAVESLTEEEAKEKANVEANRLTKEAIPSS